MNIHPDRTLVSRISHSMLTETRYEVTSLGPRRASRRRYHDVVSLLRYLRRVPQERRVTVVAFFGRRSKRVAVHWSPQYIARARGGVTT